MFPTIFVNNISRSLDFFTGEPLCTQTTHQSLLVEKVRLETIIDTIEIVHM